MVGRMVAVVVDTTRDLPRVVVEVAMVVLAIEVTDCALIMVTLCRLNIFNVTA